MSIRRLKRISYGVLWQAGEQPINKTSQLNRANGYDTQYGAGRWVRLR